MEMEKKYIIGMFALLTVGLLGASFVAAFPGGFGMFRQELTEEEMTEMHEEQQAIMQAIEDEDYETWKAMMEQRIERISSKIENYWIL